ncbi:MAG: aminodeoxychorismate lyase [Gammaproteobacteria bacterium]|nr:aminodeoxychorismate lyase [Gammaproteobacteria bacterium]MCI0590318.1 aminodeoxychorismate lyase [Gammaproteobacteria bacterium]
MVLINGAPGDCIAVNDRGLHYGDGLFETIPVVNGEPLCWERHVDRLRHGCERLRITSPNECLLFNEALRVCAAMKRGILKIILTRGSSDRGYRAPIDATATRIIADYPWPNYPEHYYTYGVTVRLCETRLSQNKQLAGIKHLNRLEQVLARSEWNDAAVAEGLMLDSQDYVIEGTMTNLFMVSGQTLITPELSLCGVAGIMRSLVIETAPVLGMTAKVAQLRLDDLNAANEIFLCNSVIGIWAVRRFIKREYPFGHWTNRILEQLHKTGVLANA